MMLGSNYRLILHCIPTINELDTSEQHIPNCLRIFKGKKIGSTFTQSRLWRTVYTCWNPILMFFSLQPLNNLDGNKKNRKYLKNHGPAFWQSTFFQGLQQIIQNSPLLKIFGSMSPKMSKVSCMWANLCDWHPSFLPRSHTIFTHRYWG